MRSNNDRQRMQVAAAGLFLVIGFAAIVSFLSVDPTLVPPAVRLAEQNVSTK